MIVDLRSLTIMCHMVVNLGHIFENVFKIKPLEASSLEENDQFLAINGQFLHLDSFL